MYYMTIPQWRAETGNVEALNDATFSYWCCVLSDAYGYPVKLSVTGVPTFPQAIVLLAYELLTSNVFAATNAELGEQTYFFNFTEES